MKQAITTELNALKPKIINPNNCTPDKSLHQQIVKSAATRLKDQDKQWSFNLGNSQTFNDPIKAAEYLLQREYGDSFLFKADNHKALFIPPEYNSNQFENNTSPVAGNSTTQYDEDKKSSTVPLLEYNIEERMNKTLTNLQRESPNYWFTSELESFLKTQAPGEEINQKAFDDWILKAKMKYLVQVELGTNRLPFLTSSQTFTKDCLNELQRNAPNSKLQSILLSTKNTRRKVRHLLQKGPREDLFTQEGKSDIYCKKVLPRIQS